MTEHLFIIADEGVDARDAMLSDFPPDFKYVTASTGEEAKRLWTRKVAGGLVSDGLPCEGGVERFVAEMAQLGARIVVLAEQADARAVARWKERGARNCLSHPTRRVQRIGRILEALGVMALDDLEERSRGSAP